MEKDTLYKHSKNKNSHLKVRMTNKEYEKLGSLSNMLDISMAEVMRIIIDLIRENNISFYGTERFNT